MISGRGAIVGRYDERMLSRTKSLYMYEAGTRPLAFEVGGVRFGCALGTAGNDLVLAAIMVLIGATIGVASGQTVIMRRGTAGEALARSGWISGFFWVLGMGSRMAFLVWISHGGSATIATFSAQHSITSSQAWTVALLGMAVAEVLGRTAVLAIRSRRIATGAMTPATA